MADLKLHGTWPSPFSYRVIWALKLKGLSYEYIEEDLGNKSPLLLKYNPVHKKIPVLVHGGKPICESMIIVEYIDETWPQNHPLLPADPLEKAQARFWCKFSDEKGPAIKGLVFRPGATVEDQEKAKYEALEVLRTIEEQALAGGKKFFGGDEIGITDLAFGWMSQWLEAFEELLGFKVLEAHAFPHLHAWAKRFKEVPAIKENLPDKDEMVVRFKQRLEQMQQNK